MSYCLKKKEHTSDGIRRIAAEEIHAVIAEIHSVPLHPENIHEARRHLKKVRALLRLVRKQFPSAAFKKENQIFRAAGKMMSPVRDAQVISKALTSLKIASGKTKPAVPSLIAVLQKYCDRQAIGKAELTKITKSLQTALGHVKDWPLGNINNGKARSLLERSFRRCKKAFSKSLKTEENEVFHEWRKRVKDLEYHLCLFEMSWRKKTKQAWKETKCLDDFLGEDHDLVLLSERLRGFKFKNGASQDDYQKIIAAICKRRTKLQRRSIKIGKVFFKERPKIFICQNVRL